jgi:multidrug efflux system membrane fusion protein
LGGAALYWRVAHERSQANAQHVAAAAVPGVPVLAEMARSGDLPIYLTGLGVVTPRNTVTVHTRVDGQLDTIHFAQGQTVHAGDLLAQIDPRPFQVQLAQFEGQLAKDQASLKNDEIQLKRDQEAAEAIPKQQVDTAEAAVAQDHGTVATDQANISSAKLNLTYCRITSPITGRIGLRLVDPGNIVHATDTTGLAVITQVQPIDVIFTLPQDDIPQVLKRMHGGPAPATAPTTAPATAPAIAAAGALTVEAFDRDLTLKLATGTLEAIDSQIDVSTGTLRFRATFPNDDQSLFPNQFVNARLLVDTLHDAVLVPAVAVQRGPTSAGSDDSQPTFVYVIKSDGTVELRNVTVGPAEGDTTSISSGLAPAEWVVTDGVDKLQPATRVTVQRQPTTAPMAKPSGATARGSP